MGSTGVVAGMLERRREAEHHLQDYVEAEARDLSGEPFTRFMNQIYKRIYALISRCASLVISTVSMHHLARSNGP